MDQNRKNDKKFTKDVAVAVIITSLAMAATIILQTTWFA